ncbi:methyltransferase [Rickettsiaceae bacterium]|nr:methyltransferase [Rickettsiaceae bacterium]
MKNIIKNNFDRASATYSKHDEVQQKAASDLVQEMRKICPNFIPNTILDIGCGTGNLIEELYRIFPQATYHINDISTSMIEQTLTRFKDIIKLDTEPGCIEEINLQHHYNLIVSNMCFQWLVDLPSVIDNLLNRTNLLVFSCLLQDSFKEWYTLLEENDIQHASRLYPSKEEVHDILRQFNQNILHESEKVFTISFHSAIEAAKYLKEIGANSPKYSTRHPDKAISFLRKNNKACKLQYKIGFFIVEGRL